VVEAVGHDWLEVTALPALELEPVEELTAPELPELVAVVVVAGAVVVVAVAPTAPVRLARAGSCPVMSTTAISDHTTRKRATEPPRTRVRIMRTRARRASLSLSPSFLVMTPRIGAIRSTGVSAV
jgi:hypothetical protein